MPKLSPMRAFFGGQTVYGQGGLVCVNTALLAQPGSQQLTTWVQTPLLARFVNRLDKSFSTIKNRQSSPLNNWFYTVSTEPTTVTTKYINNRSRRS
jgi:hypothetical protein